MSFSISPEDLLAFTFKASIGEVVGEVSAQTGAAGGEAPDDAAAKSVTAVEDCRPSIFFSIFLPLHGGEGVITLAPYSADLVRTFPDGIHLFGAFSAGSDEGFSAPSTCKCQKSPSGGVGVARVCSATSEASLGRSVASPRLGVKAQ
ncbi:hypothetical protein PS1_013056 [Malus domestica]